MSSVDGPFDYQPAATVVTKSVDKDLHEIAEMKKELWRTMRKVNATFRRKEVVEVLQKACMDDYIELHGHAIKYGGS